jgi:type I restriction enzyme S subunit
MITLVETELGPLPESWVVVELGSLATKISKGSSPRWQGFEYVSAGVLFVRSQNVGWGRMDFTDRAFLSPEFNNQEKRSILENEDILINLVGASIGRVALGSTEIEGANCNQAVGFVRLERHRSLKEFIVYYLLSPKGQQQIFAQQKDIARANLSLLDVRCLKVPVPACAETAKIARVLGAVQRAIEQQERLIALTTELKKALLHKLFTEGFHGEPQKQTEIGQVPKSWNQRPLEEAGEVIYGIQAAVASNLKPIGIKILTNKKITLDGKIALDSINYFVLKTKRHHETVLKKGDLLFNWRSGSKEHVGKTAYFDLDGEFTHSSFILRIRPTDEVTGKYLFYYLNFLRASGYFVKSQTFSVNAKFNKSAINRLPTYLPRVDQRSEIVATLDAVTRKIDVVESKRRLLEDLFRTLLNQLMTAQIRVHDVDLQELKTVTT